MIDSYENWGIYWNTGETDNAWEDETKPPRLKHNTKSHLVSEILKVQTHENYKSMGDIFHAARFPYTLPGHCQGTGFWESGMERWLFFCSYWSKISRDTLDSLPYKVFNIKIRSLCRRLYHLHFEPWKLGDVTNAHGAYSLLFFFCVEITIWEVTVHIHTKSYIITLFNVSTAFVLFPLTAIAW